MRADELDRGASAETSQLGETPDAAGRGARTSAAPRQRNAGDLLSDRQSQLCETCGERARVHLLSGYVRGARVTRHFCVPCAQAAEAALCEIDVRPRRFSLPVWVGLTAAALGVAGLSGDYLTWPSHMGFGHYKQLALLATSAALLVGVLVRVDLIAWTAGFVWAVVLYVGWSGPVRAPGFGPRQSLAVAASLGLILIGLLSRALMPRLRRLRGRDARQRPAGAQRPAEALR
jgi:hypothetical protein